MAYTCVNDLPAGDPGLLPRDAVIAIDGPAGSGKSSTARALAVRFGLLYIDTGAMYRALTQAALSAGIAPGDESALTSLLDQATLELRPGSGDATVLWGGRDVSRAIRLPEVEAAVSEVSSHPAVRGIMVRRQQNMGRRGGVVMEGRDIGSVVFPLATAKIHLTASLEARVERRLKQSRTRGLEVDRGDLQRELAERDRQDSERSTSPLTISPDAIVVDSSRLNFDEQNELCARACLVNPALDAVVDRDLAAARRTRPWQYRLFYACMAAIGRFYGLRQVGNEGCPLPNGAIVAVNHISLWDPTLIGGTFERHPVHTLAKAELFRPDWPMGTLFRWLDSIPIRRKGYDRAAFAAAAQALSRGANLLIFPEGTRQAIGCLGQVRSGLGILVQTTRAPVQPVFIRGSYGRRPGGSHLSPLEICYGPLLRWHAVDDLLASHDRREVSDRIGQLCRAAWTELQDRSYLRHPQTPFEKDLSDRQMRQFAARQAQLFGR